MATSTWLTTGYSLERPIIEYPNYMYGRNSNIFHITNGLNSLHRKWYTGNQYMVKSAENRMRSNLKVIPVTWYTTFIRFWSLIRWLIAWLMFNTIRAVFQMFSGREHVQWYRPFICSWTNYFWLLLITLTKLVVVFYYL
jgi:hypothetical protein